MCGNSRFFFFPNKQSDTICTTSSDFHFTNLAVSDKKSSVHTAISSTSVQSGHIGQKNLKVSLNKGYSHTQFQLYQGDFVGMSLPQPLAPN